MYGGVGAVLDTELSVWVGSEWVYMCETRRCMKVVLPLPAMPTQTMATGELGLLDEGMVASGVFEVDMLVYSSLVSGVLRKCASSCALFEIMREPIYPLDYLESTVILLLVSIRAVRSVVVEVSGEADAVVNSLAGPLR
jgi:hypothetical protein